MISQDDILQEFTPICRNLGWKVTPSRLAVYRYLKGNTEHPVVDVVWEAVRKELPSISRESVYRILTDFASKNLIAVLDRADVVARYDADVRRHDHFYCVRCGKVFDFEITDLESLVEPLVCSIGRVDRIEARAQGVCQKCLNDQQRQNELKTELKKIKNFSKRY